MAQGAREAALHNAQPTTRCCYSTDNLCMPSTQYCLVALEYRFPFFNKGGDTLRKVSAHSTSQETFLFSEQLFGQISVKRFVEQTLCSTQCLSWSLGKAFGEIRCC